MFISLYGRCRKFRINVSCDRRIIWLATTLMETIWKDLFLSHKRHRTTHKWNENIFLYITCLSWGKIDKSVCNNRDFNSALFYQLCYVVICGHLWACLSNSSHLYLIWMWTIPFPNFLLQMQWIKFLSFYCFKFRASEQTLKLNTFFLMFRIFINIFKLFWILNW